MFALLLAVLAQTSAPAAAPKSLAMPAWQVADVRPEVAALFSDHLAQALRAQGFQVVTATEIAALLSQERQKQLLGCADEGSSCLAELADALGADATVTVRLVRLDDAYRVHVKLLRPSDSAVLAESQHAAKTDTELLDELTSAAARLKGTFVKRKSFGVLPFLTGGAAVLSAGLGVTCLLGAQQQYRILEWRLDSPAAAMNDDNLAVASTGKALYGTGWALVGLGLALAVTTAVLFLVGGAP